MAPRVTDADVKTILETTIDCVPFINAAHVIVDDTLLSTGYSEERLTQIELWLAAHYACMRDPREAMLQLGQAGVGVTFEGTTGLGLDFSRYGQQVKVMDTSGILSTLGRARGSVIRASREET